MQPLTPEATHALQELAQRYGVSVDAATMLLHAVSAGGGTMAQFSISELGGGGQWMQGGMTMVGDMFNHGLQAKVSGLCSELSNLLRSQNVFAPVPQRQGQSSSGGFGYSGYAGGWWPEELGQPSSSGGQNDARYAYFPHVQRLAIQRNGETTVYNTLDHNIGGVQQQQGGAYGTLSFTSQRGTFTVDSLPVVSPFNAPAAAPDPAYAPNAQAFETLPSQNRSQDELLNALERLGDLRQKGILSETEFQSKKSELLSRI
jgi:hypothetical protein